MTPFAHVRPMLAVARRGPAPAEAVVEFKWDGIRVLVETVEDDTIVRSRRGLDVSATFPELGGLHGVLGPGVLLDGELVALTTDGVPSFSRLQQRLGITDPIRVQQARAAVSVSMIAFDVIAVAGNLVVEEPLADRRERLASLDVPDRVQVAPAGVDVEAVLAIAADRGLEGCVIKDPISRYEPGVRSSAWQKVRLVRRQEFVVAGWKEGSGGMAGRPTSLILGYQDANGLQFAGSVGSGLSDREIAAWEERIAASRRPDSPFVDPVPADVPTDGLHWLDPVHVVDVQFREWTPDGRLRQPSYKGVRMDVDPTDVIREPDDVG